jgi:hypothetical protein
MEQVKKKREREREKRWVEKKKSSIGNSCFVFSLDILFFFIDFAIEKPLIPFVSWL